MKITKEFKIKWFYLIVPGLITTAIWELGQYVWKKLPEAGKSIFQYLEDIPYSQAGSIEIEGLVILVLLFVTIMLVSDSISGIIKDLMALWKAKRILKEQKNIEIEKDVVDKPIKTEKRVHKGSSQGANSSTKKVIWLGVKGILWSLVTCYFIFQAIIIPLMLNDTFEKHIVIVAPYTDDNTIKKLKSDWMLMKTKADYEAIDATITTILEENKLK